MSELPPHGPLRRRRTARRLGIAALLLAAAILAALVVGRRGAPLLAPAPQPNGDPPALAELPSSFVHLPVVYELERVAELLEQSVPVRFGDLEEQRTHPAAGRVRYAFEADREAFEMEVRGDTVRVTAMLHYQARGWYDAPLLGEVTGACGSGGGQRPRARVVLSSPVEVGEDWSLRTDLRVERLEPPSREPRDRCVVGDLRVDFTEWIMLGARMALEEWTAEIDATVAGLDFRRELERYWGLLTAPVLLGEGLWLVLDPLSVRRGAISPGDADGRTVRVDLGLEARPRIVSGPRPRVSAAELPALTPGLTGGGSRVLLEARADYGLVTELARRNLEGREIELGGRSVRIREVEVSGLGDGRVVLELDVTGALRARLFLVGTPVYDPARREIAVPDLAFHVESRNVLARAGSWLLQAGFSDRIRQRARWSVGELVEDPLALGGGTLSRELSRDIRLEGSLGALEVTRVVALREALVVRSRLDGSVRLVVGGHAE